MTDVSQIPDTWLEEALGQWLAPLSLEQQQKLHPSIRPSTDTTHTEALPPSVGGYPEAAALANAATHWLMALYAGWDTKFTPFKKTLEDDINALQQQELSLQELNTALWKLAHQGALGLLWSHPRTKTKVRGTGKVAFMRSTLPQDVDVFDIPAVLAALEADHSDPAVLAAQRQRITDALSTLGHFTSKPIHTSAQPVGVTLPRNARGVGPYLTAGLVIEHGHTLWLDQAVNDNTGQAIGYLEILNGTSTEDSQATRDLVTQVAQDYFAQGRAHGTDTVDPRLRQIFLPVPGGTYRAVTPLVSMGFSAYLHSHWQNWVTVPASESSQTTKEIKIKLSHGEAVSYGFSSTAINNFTAIRKLAHRLEPDRPVGNIPNRAVLFEVPSLNEAHGTLARLAHHGFQLHLPLTLLATLQAGYTQASSTILGQDTQRAQEAEHKLLRPAIRWLAYEVWRLRDLCTDALDAMENASALQWQENNPATSVVQQFLFSGAQQHAEYSIHSREISTALARLLYQHLEHAKTPEDRSLGLSVTDRHRFMRWAPEAIAAALVQH